jgi:biopolymer transport protein ExbB/TolQ
VLGLDYQYLANPITLIVIGWLSIYLFFVFFIFFYRYISLSTLLKSENSSLNSVLMGGNSTQRSLFNDCIIKVDKVNENVLNACIEASIKKGSKGLTFLSIVSSTSPFIGLFGTVVSILIAFSKMGDSTTLALVAPAISEALIVTAIGIIVAVPAYSFHQVLSTKLENLISVLKIEKDFLISNEK